MTDSNQPNDQQQRELLKRRVALREAEEAQRMMMSRFGSGDATFIEPVQLGDPGSDRTPEGFMVDEKIAEAVGEITIIGGAILDPVMQGIALDINSDIGGDRDSEAEPMSQVVDVGEPEGALDVSHPPLERASGEPASIPNLVVPPQANAETSEPGLFDAPPDVIDVSSQLSDLLADAVEPASSETGGSVTDVLSALMTSQPVASAASEDSATIRARQEAFNERVAQQNQPSDFRLDTRSPGTTDRAQGLMPTLLDRRTNEGQGGPAVDAGAPGGTVGRMPNAAENSYDEALGDASESLNTFSETMMAFIRTVAFLLIRHTDEINELRDRLDAEDRTDGF